MDFRKLKLLVALQALAVLAGGCVASENVSSERIVPRMSVIETSLALSSLEKDHASKKKRVYEIVSFLAGQPVIPEGGPALSLPGAIPALTDEVRNNLIDELIEIGPDAEVLLGRIIENENLGAVRESELGIIAAEIEKRKVQEQALERILSARTEAQRQDALADARTRRDGIQLDDEAVDAFLEWHFLDAQILKLEGRAEEAEEKMRALRTLAPEFSRGSEFRRVERDVAQNVLTESILLSFVPGEYATGVLKDTIPIVIEIANGTDSAAEFVFDQPEAPNLEGLTDIGSVGWIDLEYRIEDAFGSAQSFTAREILQFEGTYRLAPGNALRLAIDLAKPLEWPEEGNAWIVVEFTLTLKPHAFTAGEERKTLQSLVFGPYVTSFVDANNEGVLKSPFSALLGGLRKDDFNQIYAASHLLYPGDKPEAVEQLLHALDSATLAQNKCILEALKVITSERGPKTADEWRRWWRTYEARFRAQMQFEIEDGGDRGAAGLPGGPPEIPGGD
ncbi:MAG: hypothetical protein NUW37_02325 [Planctomycetes bacterium]|nr:hypothetical protein [Planctomycetota bacterium]